MAVRSVGLTKAYGERRAVDSIDLAIPRGVVSGFVGPNGAGKTTTIRMLLGLIRPSQGTGTVLGHDLSTPAAYLSRVGALVEGPAMTPTLSGRRNLRVLTVLVGLPDSRVDEVLTIVGLAQRADEPFKSYSLGMRQRLAIAAALLPDPQLLVLDEPTNGLDPAGIVQIRQLLRELADQGMTVLVSSHLLAEIEAVCDHLVMIRQGRLVFQGTTEQLLALQRPGVVVAPEHGYDLPRLASAVRAIGHGVAVHDGYLLVDADETQAGLLNQVAWQSGITLARLEIRQASLEEAFFALTGNATGDVA